MVLIEKYRVKAMCQQICDMVSCGQMNRDVAISLINNLANEDREEDLTSIEEIATEYTNQLTLN